MNYLIKYENYGLAISDSSLPVIERTTKLSDDEFLSILKENCKSYSLDKDQLYRNKKKKFDLELFKPDYRRADPLAFKDFFNNIEDSEEYPVKRKKSLIGGTNPQSIKNLVSQDNYIVIPFDNSEIVFCPIIDLWALSDDRRNTNGKGGHVNGSPIDKNSFLKVIYNDSFKIPSVELDSIGHSIGKGGYGKTGYEYFTSSPCLLVHESKFEWLKKELSINESVSSTKGLFKEVNIVGSNDFSKSHKRELFTDDEILKIQGEILRYYDEIGVSYIKNINRSNISIQSTQGNFNIGVDKYEDEWYHLTVYIHQYVYPNYYICDSRESIGLIYKFLKKKFKNSVIVESNSYSDLFIETDEDECNLFDVSRDAESFTEKEKKDIKNIITNVYKPLNISFGIHDNSNCMVFYFFDNYGSERITDLEITICKFEDEWFILEMTINSNTTYYKCDSLDIIDKLEGFINSKIEDYL